MMDQPKTILLAEDDAQMRVFIEKVLTRQGFRVFACQDGQSAFEMFTQRNVDLLLTDLLMPHMDGVELAKKIRAIQPDIKVIFITGFSAYAMNVNDPIPEHSGLIQKPFHLSNLISFVKNAFQ